MSPRRVLPLLTQIGEFCEYGSPRLVLSLLIDDFFKCWRVAHDLERRALFQQRIGVAPPCVEAVLVSPKETSSVLGVKAKKQAYNQEQMRTEQPVLLFVRREAFKMSVERKALDYNQRADSRTHSHKAMHKSSGHSCVERVEGTCCDGLLSRAACGSSREEISDDFSAWIASEPTKRVSTEQKSSTRAQRSSDGTEC